MGATSGRESTLGLPAFFRFSVVGMNAVLSFLKSLISASAEMTAEELVVACAEGWLGFEVAADPALGSAV
jgi:hypothetical protein